MPFHECDICHKEFTRQWNLERHKQIHKESESDSGSENSNRGESTTEFDEDETQN